MPMLLLPQTAAAASNERYLHVFRCLFSALFCLMKYVLFVLVGSGPVILLVVHCCVFVVVVFFRFRLAVESPVGGTTALPVHLASCSPRGVVFSPL